ncbi:ribosomal RNA-processing protein 7 homolog A [Drosophila biarmipes]|uniref:ribosomal RNA-processing protein 7 homolog A n=1 Tax=Drosophila biarmipes TaxID=125945 RepID=UPI0007E87388|nr:ribosomal RNA-processing protein 7 homolog A [Drosophila biarmipes]
MGKLEVYSVVPLRTNPHAEICPIVFMREHFIHLTDPNKPKGRTLILLNIPPYVAEESLKKVFSPAGSIEAVEFAFRPGKDNNIKWYKSNRRPRLPFIFKVAYIVFEKANSINKALSLRSIDLFNTSGECIVKTGMELCHEEYQQNYLLEPNKTRVQISKHIAGYDKWERAVKESAKSGEVDAEGWVTVGKEGRIAGFEQKGSLVGRLEQKRPKEKKSKELKNFYTFQIRDSKMQNILEMRKKFMEDKRKIELLKQSRRFKPF